MCINNYVLKGCFGNWTFATAVFASNSSLKLSSQNRNQNHPETKNHTNADRNALFWAVRALHVPRLSKCELIMSKAQTKLVY